MALTPSPSGAEELPTLQSRLEEEAKKECIRGQTDLGTLEARFLDLLRKHDSPTEKGQIYAATAFLFFRTDASEYLPEILEYSKKALAHPLPPVEATLTYRRCADALMFKYSGAKGEAFTAGRREMASFYLNAIKVAVDNMGTTPRNVKSYMLPPLQNELLIQRHGVSELLVGLYTRQPYATQELKRLATEIVKNDKAVDELVQDIEDHIAGKQGRDWFEPFRPPPQPARDPKVEEALRRLKTPDPAK